MICFWKLFHKIHKTTNCMVTITYVVDVGESEIRTCLWSLKVKVSHVFDRPKCL